MDPRSGSPLSETEGYESSRSNESVPSSLEDYYGTHRFISLDEMLDRIQTKTNDPDELDAFQKNCARFLKEKNVAMLGQCLLQASLNPSYAEWIETFFNGLTDRDIYEVVLPAIKDAGNPDIVTLACAQFERKSHEKNIQKYVQSLEQYLEQINDQGRFQGILLPIFECISRQKTNAFVQIDQIQESIVSSQKILDQKKTQLQQLEHERQALSRLTGKDQWPEDDRSFLAKTLEEIGQIKSKIQSLSNQYNNAEKEDQDAIKSVLDLHMAELSSKEMIRLHLLNISELEEKTNNLSINSIYDLQSDLLVCSEHLKAAAMIGSKSKQEDQRSIEKMILPPMEKLSDFFALAIKNHPAIIASQKSIQETMQLIYKKTYASPKLLKVAFDQAIETSLKELAKSLGMQFPYLKEDSIKTLCKKALLNPPAPLARIDVQLKEVRLPDPQILKAVIFQTEIPKSKDGRWTAKSPIEQYIAYLKNTKEMLPWWHVRMFSPKKERISNLIESLESLLNDTKNHTTAKQIEILKNIEDRNSTPIEDLKSIRDAKNAMMLITGVNHDEQSMPFYSQIQMSLELVRSAREAIENESLLSTLSVEQVETSRVQGWPSDLGRTPSVNQLGDNDGPPIGPSKSPKPK